MQPGNGFHSHVAQQPRQISQEVIQQILIARIGDRQFQHWFQNKTRFACAGTTLIVSSATPFLQTWIQKRHRAALLEVAGEFLGTEASLQFEIDESLNHTETPSVSTAAVPAAPTNSPLDGATPPSLPKPVATSSPNASPNVVTPGRRFASFDEFIVGTGNQLAYTAARQVCDHFADQATPCYVYGPVGCGKTHLAESIYREIRRRHPHLNVLFLTAEQFTNQFTQSFRSHSLPTFRQRFRSVDVLLMDDVDFLDAKRVVQEEFLHTVQQLESHRKQLVACGERHPRQLTKISDELRTRLLSGMVCRLDKPDLETRERIAVAKARRIQLDVSLEVLKYVARKFSGTIRELEGALHCLLICQRMTGQRVSLASARDVLGDLERDCLRPIQMADIERVVCELFGVPADMLRSPSRSRTATEPRMLAMYLARRLTRSAYSEIGAYFGGRNHATVIAADQKISAGLSDNVELKVASQTWKLADIVETLEQQLMAG
jgi:chromosomal replication initiator protein